MRPTRGRSSIHPACGRITENGNLTDTIDIVPGSAVLNIEKGQWHSLKCQENGTVLFDAKDGPYSPLGPEDILAL